MCTIHTYSKKYYSKYQREINGQLIQDAVSNDDGISVVFLDGHKDKTNTIYRTMDVDNAIAVIGMLMGEATKYARVFIHLRAATTASVGVGFTHAFDDMNGVLYMHNGVIANTSNLSVDSYNMVNWSNLAGNGLLTQLVARKEYFANVLRIDTVNYRWSVTRMTGGWLHTDGHGNYSTRPYGSITTVVGDRTTQSYTLPFVPKPKYGNYYGGGGGGSYSSDYGYGSSGGTTGGWNGNRQGSYSHSYEGKRWDYETKEYIPEAEWERRRKARSDAWTAMYDEEDEVGLSGDTGRVIPPFNADPNRLIETRVEKGAVDTVIRRLSQGEISATQQLLDDGEIPDPIETEVDIGSGELGEALTPAELAELREYGFTNEEIAAEYGYSITQDGVIDVEAGRVALPVTPPVVLGPPVPTGPPVPASCETPAPTGTQCEVHSGTSSREELSSPKTGTNYDLQKYREWLRRHPRGA